MWFFRTPHLVEGATREEPDQPPLPTVQKGPLPRSQAPWGERKKGPEKQERETVGCMGWVGNGSGAWV